MIRRSPSNRPYPVAFLPPVGCSARVWQLLPLNPVVGRFHQ